MKIFKEISIKGLGKKYQGKVRDHYVVGDKRILITTDRISAFDRVLGHIPYKGQVLNELSSFWFEKTRDIIPSHVLSIPDPNVMVVKNCTVIPIEMVVRGYISGVTSTSLWTAYARGERVIYGIRFPEGLRKNQKLKTPIITPTTKAEKGHDERLTEEEILKQKIVSKTVWQKMKKAALALFRRGQIICDRAGIILVDTKYEMGLYRGRLMLIDEVHTPDSSRYWVKKTYGEKFEKGLEPESYDKEPLRIWFKEHGYRGKGKPPKMPKAFIAKMSTLYQGIYEKITGRKFVADTTVDIAKRIERNLRKAGIIESMQ